MKANKGFTLIELMIVIAVIGIIAAFAYPAYQDSIEKSRRRDAQAALQGFAQAMERHYTDSASYAGAAGTSGAPKDTGAPWIFPSKSPIDGSQSFYNLKVVSATATGYVLAAEPVNGQAGDGILVLKSTGARGWDRNNSAGGVVGGLGASPNEVEAGEWCWENSC
ncbi:type IV pilin protein [Hahella aquimaris]|uniref:type IV pilin protein n=1 Tax=Hahella sp. HNIBRBA332 TaxID=3015983 RepID=UPI00273AA247|nr:type IV pilin protein [Hahella sp. HNIBRBA332]WLQ14060.1 type IV pilin protein [Hahella sp. HNIBRBA332]